MTDPYAFFALLILITTIAGIWRVFKGPTRADRMLSAQLCGTTMVAVILLLAHSRKEVYLLDVALVFAVLTAVATVGFVRLVPRRVSSEEEGVTSDA